MRARKPIKKKKTYRGGGKLRGKEDHGSSALPRPSFLLGLAAGSKSDWLSVTFSKGWGHIRFTVGNKLVVEGVWQGGARLSYLRWERPMVIQATSPRKSFRAFKILASRGTTKDQNCLAHLFFFSLQKSRSTPWGCTK